MTKLSTERAIDALDTVRAYYASLTVGYPKGKDCKGIGDVMCSEIANSCLIAIKALRQEPKTGHWVRIKPYPLQMHDYECSECGHETDDNTENYCSNCGAKMVEPQERSD